MIEKLKIFNNFIAKNIKYVYILFIAILQLYFVEYQNGFIMFFWLENSSNNIWIIFVTLILGYIFLKKILKKDHTSAIITSIIFTLFNVFIAIKLKYKELILYFSCNNILTDFEYSILGNFDARMYEMIFKIGIGLILVLSVKFVNKNKKINLQIINKTKSIKLSIPILVIITLVISFGFSIVQYKLFKDLVILLLFNKCFLVSLLGIILFTIFWAIFRKVYLSTIICYLIVFVFSVVMKLKIKYTGEPLLFSDINFLKNIDVISTLVSKEAIIEVLKEHFAFIIFFGLIIILSFKWNLTLKNAKLRISILIIDFLILMILFVPNNATKEFFLKKFLDSESYKDFDSYTTNYSYCIQYGMITGMYGIHLNTIFHEPEGYNEAKLNQIVNISTNNENANKKDKIQEPTNLILFFSESFWSVDELEEIEFDKEITSNFNRLKSKGKLINLITPSYGGMSENVAFEFLTGGSMNYFPNGYIPVMSLYSKKNATEIPSILKILKDSGYQSEIIFGVDAYNSKKAMHKIGFDEYVELSKLGYSTDDETTVNYLIDNLKEDDGKRIYMVESYEGHMPYNIHRYDNYDFNIMESNLTKNEMSTLKTYAQAMFNADKQLGKLYQYIENFEEPTILVFMGDHLPYIQTGSGVNLIDKLEYFNTDDELLNYYRKYNTQCLILANYDISSLEVPEYSGVDLVLPNLLNQMDIDNNTNYYKWLNSTKECISASNKYITLDKDGNMYYTQDLTGEMKELYELREMIQYKYFIK